MKLKAELEKEVRVLKRELELVKKIPCGQRMTYCPDCGNPVLINDGAYTERLRHTFYCAVGHKFTYSS